MKAWAQGKHSKYWIPSETVWFAKLALALELCIVDEDAIDRQRPVWRDGLLDMHAAQQAPPDNKPDEEAARKLLLGG